MAGYLGRTMDFRNISDRTSKSAFFGVSALLFVVGAVVTIVSCKSMSAMGGMPMPGGWTMSMAWMRMPGQTWAEVAGSFLRMWVVMMLAMMLPSFVLVGWRYREDVRMTGEKEPDRLTALVGGGYFFAWTVFGILIFPLGVMFAMIAMHIPVLSRAVPIAVGVTIVSAGAIQFTAWKQSHLAQCRMPLGRDGTLRSEADTAWRHGLHIGLHCCYCCANLTAILIVSGVMDLRTMAALTAAITVERLAPTDGRVSRAIGALIIGAGLVLMARAAELTIVRSP